MFVVQLDHVDMATILDSVISVPISMARSSVIRALILVKGCCPAFCMYCNAWAWAFTKVLGKHEVGVRIHNIRVGSLFWADDVVLLANDEHELNRMLELAAQYAREWKLSFNHDKSNVLIVGQRTSKDKLWKLGNEYISEVDSYKYLGVNISRNLTDHCHIEEVIKKGNRPRLIAYVKSVINNFDDFNRVYYGDILWKTIVLPSINYSLNSRDLFLSLIDLLKWQNFFRI